MNMNDEFEVYEYRYFDKETKTGFCVYAREEKTAKEIIDIENDHNIYNFIKPKFRRFKRKYLSGTPPYELEQEQMDVALKRRENRFKYLAKNGNDSLSKEKENK